MRNESVDGEAAMLNTMRHEDEDAKEDAHIWIPKAEDYHFAMNRMWLLEGQREKEHPSTRFEYQPRRRFKLCVHKER